MIDQTTALELFRRGCIAFGYMHDTGKTQIANDLQTDLFAYVSKLGETTEARNNVLLEALNSATDKWERLCIASLIRDAHAERASSVFDEVEKTGGIAATFASVWRGTK
jgi:hypothetical protein